jgi:GH24 family phage-related lysozyme (muramidase)
MALDIAKLEKHYGRPNYEGRFGHMYLDGEGHVTIGIGHLIFQKPRNKTGIKVSVTTVDDKTKKRLAGIHFRINIKYKDAKKKDETRAPTAAELEYAFKKVASRTPGYLGRAYEKFANLAYKTNTADWPDYADAQIDIDDKEISRLFKEDIEGKISDIKRVLPYCQGGKFDKLPEPAQEAIVDMAFNLGAVGLNKNFGKFNSAMAAGDYRKAANESERNNVQADRNKYVKDLLLKAAAETDKLKKAAGAP